MVESSTMLRVFSRGVNQIPELVCVYSTYLTPCRYSGRLEDRWKRFLPKRRGASDGRETPLADSLGPRGCWWGLPLLPCCEMQRRETQNSGFSVNALLFASV